MLRVCNGNMSRYMVVIKFNGSFRAIYKRTKQDLFSIRTNFNQAVGGNSLLGKIAGVVTIIRKWMTPPFAVLIETNQKDILNLFGGLVMGKGIHKKFFSDLRVGHCQGAFGIPLFC